MRAVRDVYSALQFVQPDTIIARRMQNVTQFD